MLVDPGGSTASRSLPAILIYRSDLLSLSETFVLTQSEAMKQFIPYFVGRSRVDGLKLPEDKCHIIDEDGAFGSAKKNVYRLFGLAPGLIRKLSRLSPVLMHAHFGVDSVSALYLARRLSIPMVVTFHGYDATMKEEYARKFSFDYRRYLRWRPTVQREAAFFIAVSEFIRGRLIEQGFPPEKIAVHYVGVDTEVFAPDLSVRRTPVVLFVGRLVDSKGCSYLIQAMERVQREVPNAQLVVIGNGPLRRDVEQKASGCLKHVMFLGAQSQTEVRYWMNRATVFSVPSFTTPLGTSEGFGLVFAEAQAMGLPVASFATGGIPEAVAHGVTGLLARERDVQGLADNISRLLRNHDLWHQFSTAARKRAQELFDLHEQTTKLEEMYRRLLSHQPVTAARESLPISMQG